MAQGCSGVADRLDQRHAHTFLHRGAAEQALAASAPAPAMMTVNMTICV